MTLMPKNKGFTLVELLIVVAIIAILTGMLTVNLADARERARDAQRKADLKQIQNALELYKNDQNPQSYPQTDSWKNALTTNGFMKKIPSDPTHDQVASWPDISYTRNDVLEYDLVVCLENAADVDKDDTNTCTSGYSYSLTEP
jgi:prepilin-type N-terminal cleavage/methylation domain-containing protein